MTLIAVTDIEHGRPTAEGTEVFHFDAGDEVDESIFTEDQLDSLKKTGAVEESKHLEKVDELRKQVEELQAQLAAMESEHAAISNEVTNARNVDQTALDPQKGIPAGTPLDPETGKPVEAKKQVATKPSTPAK